MIGTRLGHYEIVAKIGEGGMGEVYRAHDTQLDRDVAIKVLSKHRLDSDDAHARFEREAKAVAALSHPNILAIHGFGEHEGTAYAVTELLEGNSIQEQLQQGPLPLRRTLDLAAQMADGLAAAHDKGIVHRDLKPGNLFLTQDGRLKILDFGLAKAVGPHDTAATQAATMGGGDTTPGTLLGTVRYMSPEQVRGEAVDHRSDIFSFGTVLWEMLSAQTPFERDSGVETMNAILHEDLVDVSTLKEGVPASVDRILHRCLEKSPEQRFQSAHDLGFALRTVTDSSSRSSIQGIAAPAAPSRRGLPPVALAIMGLVLGLGLGAFGMQQYARTPELDPVKVIPLTHSGKDWAPSASPDGRLIAFTSDRDGEERIWLRQMNGGVEAPLTQGQGFLPRFSPDGSTVLFHRDEGQVRAIYRIPVLGGAPRKTMENANEATWSPDGSQLAFTRFVGESVSTGTSLGIFDLDSSEERIVHTFDNLGIYGLDWSADPDWILGAASSATNNTRQNHILKVHASTGEVVTLVDRPFRFSSAAWSRDGRSIFFAQSESLLGDLASPIGRMLRIGAGGGNEDVLFWVHSVYAGGGDVVVLTTMPDGSLVYDDIAWRGSLTALSLDGELPLTGGSTLTTGNSRDRQPAYSPDGRHVTFSSTRSGNLDIWVLEVETGLLRQLTDDKADDWDPAFTPDGHSILWSSNRSGPLEIWRANADGSGARQLSNDGEDAENPTQTPDGEWVVYASANPGRNGIWKIRTDGSEETQVAAGSYLLPEVSPDSRYVAFIGSDIPNNRTLIYVSDLETKEVVFTTELEFKGLRNVVQIGRTRWMPDGQTLVFVGLIEGNRRTLFTQDFRPGADTSDTRRILIDLESDSDIESFGISPDGSTITVALLSHFRTIKLAAGIP